MKKEINALLASESATLNINHLFFLRRWVLKPETDTLGRSGDYLELEMMHNKTMSVVRIESRTVSGIIEEVAQAMQKMMDAERDSLISKWNGGLL